MFKILFIVYATLQLALLCRLALKTGQTTKFDKHCSVLLGTASSNHKVLFDDIFHWPSRQKSSQNINKKKIVLLSRLHEVGPVSRVTNADYLGPQAVLRPTDCSKNIKVIQSPAIVWTRKSLLHETQL